MILQVRQCEHQNLWGIERYRDGDWLGLRPGLNIYALCTPDRPIWAPSAEAAMCVAEHCHPTPQSPVVGHWEQVY
jgi:hypothetical protein